MSSTTAGRGPNGDARADDFLLEVKNLSVAYESDEVPPVQAVDRVSFSLRKGEFVGLVGESGSGKSTLGFAITRLQKPPAVITGGNVVFDGRDIREMDPESLRRQRQGGFAMVLQSGMNALNPVRTIGHHFTDIFKAHGHVQRKDWWDRARYLVDKVELPPGVLARYPAELSGGMRQRVSIALALSLEPRLMVFDEPTTALDVLVQHAVMDTITTLQESEGFTAVLISHDLGVVLEATERVMVMHKGRIVENAPSDRILSDPQNDYTKMLLSHYADPRAEKVSLPGFEHFTRADAGVDTPAGETGRASRRLVVENVSKTYPPPSRGDNPVRAVRNVSFTLEPGQALALVGQSGSGKSTIAKLITGVEKPSEGRIAFGDLDVTTLPQRRLRRLHEDVQMIFQDPYSAQNPVLTVEYQLSRPIRNFTQLRGNDARDEVRHLLETVGLTPAESFVTKLPHQLSGGQRQRVVVARALACNPQVIIADEPVSMLDVSLRAGVLKLIEDLRRERGVSLLYITHDLLSARLVTDDILVLHEGEVVERGATTDVMLDPQDEYTRALLEAIPNPARAHEERARRHNRAESQ
ncbi:ABC transporter ATP-binding protein [Arthrobacter sp. E3]|uniref:ABC transporter ATP-binding protein n=1 Tax=Arthrobacter sp. E3 TaxID=517402 RepID=UPI001A94A9E9|nr:ABC transporter ATP-binding protein [Arthrobacter sp. E3]